MYAKTYVLSPASCVRAKFVRAKFSLGDDAVAGLKVVVDTERAPRLVRIGNRIRCRPGIAGDHARLHVSGHPARDIHPVVFANRLGGAGAEQAGHCDGASEGECG